MRKQLLGTTWALLAIVVMASAQTPGTEAASHAALQKIGVSRGDGGITIEMTAKGAVTPTVETLSSPARIVVDLPNTVVATSLSRIHIGRDGVTGLRVGTDASKTTRVVVDLERLCKYELVPGPGEKFTLKLETGAAVATTVTHTPNVAAPAKTKTEIAKNTASDFLFVEPTFSPKKDAPQVNPPARTVEAASKFVERPQGNLLPTVRAAMDPQAQTAAATPVPVPVPEQGSAPAQSSSPTTEQRPVPAAQPAVNMAAEQKAHPQPAVSNPKYTGEPVSVNLKDVDLKDFFRLVHEISGLNVVLDPDVHGSLTIVLDDVPWDQALDIVLKNNNLSRQLDGNVLRIATVDTLRREAEGRHAQQEAEAMAVDKVTVTRFLSYAHSKDVVTTVKKFLSSRGDIVADDRTNAIIISDIPSTIPAVDRLIQQLDRKTQEVEIEARVVAATRSFARDIGTQLGIGWENRATAIGGTNATAGTTATSTTIGNVMNTIPLFSNLAATGPTSAIGISNISKSLQLDAILTMAESRGLLKILSRPRVVTQNNIQAIVKQGVRIPVESAATLGAPATITYVDAFLKLTVTPQITVENTIFLNVDVENTTPDFGHQINGNPTLITQQATTQVLVTDGGTVVIGGVIQTNNSVSIAQVPLLGSIPWLGNLFKHQTVNSSNQELIFFITPRVIET
ncbi:MAG: type and secretion system protein [Acidobacteriaceae bacterium]|nr:type and secretion system protein [Acidobacteriaceae bacterium]